jgi:hypothetical protein
MKAVELEPGSGLWGGNFDLIKIYIKIGEYDKAIELIKKELAAKYSDITQWVLKLDPRFDLLRDDPRFQALVE